MKYLFTSVIYAIPVFISGAGYIPKKFNLPFLLRAIIGSLLVCLMVSPVLFYHVRTVKTLFILFIAFGYILLFLEIKRNLKSFSRRTFLLLFRNMIRPIALFIIYFLLISALFYDFFPLNYIYNEHDLLYWSWPSEIYRANYSGGIRSEIAWPMQFTSYHVLPGLLLAYLNIFSPIQTMVGILLQKYLFLVSVPAVMLTASRVKGFKYLIRNILCFGIPILIFRDEISYNISISNYLIVYLILICFWVMFQANRSVRMPTVTLLFFLMIFSKLTVFVIAFCIFIFYFLRNRAFFSRVEQGLMFSIFLLNLYTWVFVKKPFESSSIDVADLFTLEYLGSMRKLVDWVIDPTLVNLQFPLRHYFSFFVVIFILVKIFLLFYFSINRIFNHLNRFKQNTVFGDNAFSYYLTWYGFMLLSLLTLIFFRTSSTSEIKHAAHLLFIGSVVTALIMGITIGTLLNSKKNYIFVSFILIILALVSPYKVTKDVSFFSPKHELNNTSLSIKSISQSIFVIKGKTDNHVQKQIQSSILGTRLECTDLDNDKTLSPIYLFLYLPNNEIC